MVQTSDIFYSIPDTLGKFYHVLSLAHSLPSSLNLSLSVHRTIFLVHRFIILVMGVIERDRGTLYCSVLSFGSGGKFLGKHCKLMPTASERLVWGFGDGSTLPVFDTPIGRVGTSNSGLDLLQAFYLSPSILKSDDVP